MFEQPTFDNKSYVGNNKSYVGDSNSLRRR